jgi:hypothetical protein
MPILVKYIPLILETMKNRFFMIGFVAFFSSHIVFGQNLIMREYLGTFVPVKRVFDYSEVEGSPYLNDKLIGGIVKFNNGDSLNQYLRYDMYSDEIEYLEKGKLFNILKSQMKNLDHIYLNGNSIIYKDYFIKKKVHSGYLFELVNAQCGLYKRLRVEFQNAKPAKTSYHKPTPAQFVTKSVQWFYSFNGEPISFFKADNAGLKIIGGSHYEDLKEFVKENGIKLKKEADLIILFKYYNSLLEN